MAAFFAQMSWPLKRRQRIERKAFPNVRRDRKVLELETAKEILQEVFGTTSDEVEEMIQLRLEELEIFDP